MNQLPKKTFIYFGGSFDPIHLGHLYSAEALQKIFTDAKIYFLPCGNPALKRSCIATKAQRLEMLKLALRDYPGFTIDIRELDNTNISYTIETLKNLRLELGDEVSLSFVIGQDAFANFMQWHEWEHILDYCHIINQARPHQACSYSKDLQKFIKQHETHSPSLISKKNKGYIYQLKLGDFPYSSTAIREDLKHNQKPQGLPPLVEEYIQQNHLYKSSQFK